MKVGVTLGIGLLLLVAIVPALPTTVRGLCENVTRAISLRTLVSEERQHAILGPPFTIAVELRSTLPEDAPIDFVMMTPQSRELAQFAGAYLSPRPCRYFEGEEAWRRRERAIWIRDARGANAPPGRRPGPAVAVVMVDARCDPPMWIVR